MDRTDYAFLDAALDPLAGQGPSLSNGFVNHAPMVVEALVAMGRPDAASLWIAAHHENSLPARDDALPFDHEQWKGSLGRHEDGDRWRAFFRRECATGQWPDLLDLWASRLAPGLFAAALHGLIRVAHGARALSVEDTPLRRRELAEGFALWAASYQTLPTDMGATATERSPLGVLGDMRFVPDDKRHNEGAITTALTRLSYAPGFEQVIVAIDWDVPLSPLAYDIARAFARLFLDQVDTPLKAIVYTHAITGAAAVLNMAPHVHADTARQLLTYVWQAGCGLYAAYGVRPAVTLNAMIPETADESCERAIAHGDDHVIKLTEACLRFHAETGDDVFLALSARARSLL